ATTRETETREALVREAAARSALQAKEQEARNNLRNALLQQARALSNSLGANRRQLALDALKQAAAVRPDADLRMAYLRCLDLADLAPVQTNFRSPGSELISFSGSENHVLVRTREGKFNIYEAATGRPVKTWQSAENPKHPIAYSPDGRWCLDRNAKDKPVALWDLEREKRLGGMQQPNA